MDYKIKIYHINMVGKKLLRNPINLIAGRKFMLQEKDIVFIPPTKIVKWNRTISLLLPQTGLFKSYGPVYYDGFENTYGAN